MGHEHSGLTDATASSAVRPDMTRRGREQDEQDNILDSFDLCVDRGWSGVLDAVLRVISAQDD
jgi:hypothetical protein